MGSGDGGDEHDDEDLHVVAGVLQLVDTGQRARYFKAAPRAGNPGNSDGRTFVHWHFPNISNALMPVKPKGLCNIFFFPVF